MRSWVITLLCGLAVAAQVRAADATPSLPPVTAGALPVFPSGVPGAVVVRPGAGNLPTLATPGFFPPGFVGMEPRAAAGMTPQGASVRGTDAATAANANRIQSPVERIDPMSGNPFAEDEPSSAQGRAAPPSKR